MANDERLNAALKGLGVGPGRAVLIVESSPDHQARLARLIAVHGHRAIGTSTLEGALAFLAAFPVDLVLLDEQLGGQSPLRVVAQIVGLRPHARIVIMTRPEASGGSPEGERFGALEYVSRSLGGDVLQELLAS